MHDLQWAPGVLSSCSWDDPDSDRKLRVWSRPSICKDLVYLQHKTSSGWTNCFWKNHTTCCLGTGWLFVRSMMKWWRGINPVMVMTTSHLLHTEWVANLVAAMAITWWSNASWPKWSKLWTLLTTRFLRYMASALQSWGWQGEAHEEWFCTSPGLRLGTDNMQMHLSGWLLKLIENQSENPFSSCVSWELHNL